MKALLGRGCAVLAGVLALGAPAQAALTVVLKNENSSFKPANCYVYFPGGFLDAKSGGKTLVPGKSYSFADLASGIALTRYDGGGRICFSVGKPLPDGQTPEPTNPDISSYHVRFDKIEMTYVPNSPFNCANLTSLDFFAIPLRIRTYKNGQLQQTLTFNAKGNEIFSKLSALSKNNASAVRKEGGKYLRVLGPNNSIAEPAYPSLKGYVDSVKGSRQAIKIADKFFGNPAKSTPEAKPQDYNFTGTFASNGDLHLKGSGTVVGQNQEIVIGYKDLYTNIYKANPPYKVNGRGAVITDNDVYAAAVRDVLAGFDLGFVGSTTKNPATGHAFKDDPSKTWWSSKKAFAFLQPQKPYYDRYAQYISENSNSYGFPFSDRWVHVQANLSNGIDKMEITILPD